MTMIPTAVVTVVLDITADPKEPANIIVTLGVRFLFIAAAAALGYALVESRILTTTDMVGNW